MCRIFCWCILAKTFLKVPWIRCDFYIDKSFQWKKPLPKNFLAPSDIIVNARFLLFSASTVLKSLVHACNWSASSYASPNFFMKVLTFLCSLYILILLKISYFNNYFSCFSLASTLMAYILSYFRRSMFTFKFLKIRVLTDRFTSFRCCVTVFHPMNTDAYTRFRDRVTERLWTLMWKFCH